MIADIETIYAMILYSVNNCRLQNSLDICHDIPMTEKSTD